jgi:hypothetical protein
MCSGSKSSRKNKSVLIDLEYHNTVAENARDALKKMRYHTFDLVILDELFDCKNYHSNGVLIYLQHLPMNEKKHLFNLADHPVSNNGQYGGSS